MKYFIIAVTLVLSGCATTTRHWEMQSCTSMCESGVVKSYKFCKCTNMFNKR